MRIYLVYIPLNVSGFTLSLGGRKGEENNFQKEKTET